MKKICLFIAIITLASQSCGQRTYDKEISKSLEGNAEYIIYKEAMLRLDTLNLFARQQLSPATASDFEFLATMTHNCTPASFSMFTANMPTAFHDSIAPFTSLKELKRLNTSIRNFKSNPNFGQSRLDYWEEFYEKAHDYQLPDIAQREQEANEYNIKNGTTILEVGGGYGEFSMFLISKFENLTIYLNEIDTIYFEMINYRAKHIVPNISKGSQLIPVLGSESSVMMGDTKVDKVIIRDAFHHFSQPKAMLQSIQNTLKPTGKIYLLEQFTDDSSTECEYAYSQEELYEVLKGNGFKVVKNIRLASEYHILEIEYSDKVWDKKQ